MKRIVVAGLGIAALAGSIDVANAADLARRYEPVQAPVVVPAPIFTWTGFYVGANLGYGWSDIRGTLSRVGRVTGSGDGVVGGGQIGYNWQSADWVFGLETDAQWTGQRGSASTTCPATVIGGPCLPGVTIVPAGALGTVANLDQKLEWFGTFRGRVGSLVGPTVLFYATGGAAYGTVKTDIALAGFTPAGLPIGISGSSSDTRVGWTVGAGVEWMFVPNWTAKVEYLYMDLGTVSSAVVLPTATGFAIGASLDSRIRDNIIRGGINYKF